MVDGPAKPPTKAPAREPIETSVQMPRETPARPPTEMNDIPMVESEPFYCQVMRPEPEKPATDSIAKPSQEAIIGKTDKLSKSLKTSEQSQGMMDKPCKPLDSDLMDKPVKPLDVGMMDKSMKPSDVQSEGERITPEEAENNYTKTTLEKATPGPARREESQSECMKRCSTRICQSST